MPSFDLGSVLAVDHYGAILGQIAIGKMHHNVIIFKTCLQFFDTNSGRSTLFLNGLTGCVSGGLLGITFTYTRKRTPYMDKN